MLKRSCLHLRRLVSYLRRQVLKREIPWRLLARQTTENNWKLENVWRRVLQVLALLGCLPWGLLAATFVLAFLLRTISGCPDKAKQISLQRGKARGRGEKSEKKKEYLKPRCS